MIETTKQTMRALNHCDTSALFTTQTTDHAPLLCTTADPTTAPLPGKDQAVVTEEVEGPLLNARPVRWASPLCTHTKRGTEEEWMHTQHCTVNQYLLALPDTWPSEGEGKRFQCNVHQ